MQLGRCTETGLFATHLSIAIDAKSLISIDSARSNDNNPQLSRHLKTCTWHRAPYFSLASTASGCWI
jgi:hypothetical protein